MMSMRARMHKKLWGLRIKVKKDIFGLLQLKASLEISQGKLINKHLFPLKAINPSKTL